MPDYRAYIVGCADDEAAKEQAKQLEQSREAERRRIVEEHVIDLREIVKKLRKPFN
jgi:hypothetical protein